MRINSVGQAGITLRAEVTDDTTVSDPTRACSSDSELSKMDRLLSIYFQNKIYFRRYREILN